MPDKLYNEIEPHAAAWLRNLIALGELPEGQVDERSIVDLRGDDLAGCDEAHFFAGIGVWARAVAEAERASNTGSADHSSPGHVHVSRFRAHGQRKGHADERHLWPAFHRLIAERRPATILGEQVASKDGREWMAAVRHDLEASGYAVGCAVLPAGGFGAPHIRYRLFFVADAQGGTRCIEPGERGERGGAQGLDELAQHGGLSGGLADAAGERRIGQSSAWLHERRNGAGRDLPAQGDTNGASGDDAARRGDAGFVADASRQRRQQVGARRIWR